MKNEASYNQDGLVIFLSLSSIILCVMILSTIIENLKKRQTKEELWQKFLRKNQSHLIHVQDLCDAGHFEESSNLYRSVRSKINRSCLKILEEHLKPVLKKNHLNLRVSQNSTQIHALLDDQQYIEAYRKTQVILHEIENADVSLLNNPQLIIELKSIHTELKQQICEKRQDIQERINATSHLIKSQQYDLLICKFDELLQELQQWPFIVLKKELNERYQLFLKFQKTFQLNRDDRLTNFLEKLDTDFQDWTSKEIATFGKKI
ncbi:hypothetical protein NEF87_005085 [Candidatus Lokiarchaeum ossiferum]|uniref:Uncharacterized protein n=1 Tax=Candidatus Lokiarchaeum ossiferum TaxID=2951803 RepID=A0ABY6HZG2_9ARCH|nr:hypothetical protein NEF87_005085 [Candidatus Lokiarchaeum sp. B-35]